MIVELGLLLLTLIIFLFYNYVFWPLSYWKKLGVSYLYPYPLVGNLLEVLLRRKSFPEFFLELHKTTKEKLIGVNFFSVPIIFVKDLDLIQDVTIKHFDHFVNHSSLFFDLTVFPEAQNNLFNIKDDHWRSIRSSLTSAFTSAKLRQTAPLIQENYQNLKLYLDKLIDNSDNGIGEFQTKSLYGPLICDIIMNTSFGISINSFDDGNHIVHEMIKRNAVIKHWKAALNNLFGPKFLKFFNITLLDSTSTNFLIEMLKNTYKIRREQNVKRLDTIEILLEAQKNSIEKNKLDKSVKVLTEADLVAQSFLFFFAGYEAVSNALTFQSLELCLNPEIQQKLYEEIMSIYEDDEFPLEKLMSLKYLNCVIQEQTRKWPALPVIDRLCTKDYKTIVDGKSILIKSGSIVMYSIIGNHRDPKNYPDPEKFDPDRFADENSKERHSCASIAFGSGPRYCIGMRFAMLELKIVLANLLKDFELVPARNTLVPIKLDPSAVQTIPFKGALAVKKRN